jgi:hypothetical protein
MGGFRKDFSPNPPFGGKGGENLGGLGGKKIEKRITVHETKFITT